MLRVRRGVYAVGYEPLTHQGRWMAAVLAAGPDAALSHRTAGALWKILPRWALLPEVTRPRKFGRIDDFVGHYVRLPADELTVQDGIPVTTPPRTVFDCAAVLKLRPLERMFHELEVRELRDALSVPDLIERHPGHRGVANLQTVMGSKEPGGVTRNEFEEAFVALLDAHALPRPRMNASLWVRGRFFEADAVWEDQQLIVELDGGGVHRTERAFQSDRQRDRILLAEGWRTPRVTWHQLRDEPGEVAADLRRVLEPNQPIPPVPQSRYPHPPAK
jgi:very-short-patch-repair endonuclease